MFSGTILFNVTVLNLASDRAQGSFFGGQRFGGLKPGLEGFTASVGLFMYALCRGAHRLFWQAIEFTF